jgi:hypothetical protein
MISLRQHAFSLAAVFIALALGVVLGSGFLSDTLLSSLRDEKRDLYTQINGLNDQKNVLNEKLSAANNFDNQLVGRIVHDALGEFVDANSAEKLRTVVNSSVLPAGQQLSTKLVDQGSQAGDLLGIALLINANPAIPPVDDGQRDTVLAALRDTGFVTYQPSDHLGAANAALIVTGGALPQDAGNQGVSVARFSAALAPHGSGTLLAGRDGSSTGGAAVAVARADAAMNSAITTVDDVDAAPGRITAILGLHDLLNGGHVGQYGAGHGATSITVPQ